MQRLEHTLLPWVRTLIMPLFALANAGVILNAEFAASFGSRVTLGIVAGLVLGKPLGIAFFSWLTLRLNLAVLPEGVRRTHILGAAALGGIGFTMSLFIANLGFGGDSELALAAKAGVLAGSLLAGATGLVIIWRTVKSTASTGSKA